MGGAEENLQDFPHANLVELRATLTGIYGERCTVWVTEWSHLIAKRLRRAQPCRQAESLPDSKRE
jgi:hypothetical protein